MHNHVTPLLQQWCVVSMSERIWFPDKKCLSIDSIARLLRLTMSIDAQFSGAIVAAMFYSLSLVQGVSTQYKIHLLTTTAHCPN